MNRTTTPRPARLGAQPSPGDQATVLTRIAQLQTLTHDELKARWRELYAAPAPPVYNRPFLLRRLAYRIQELAFGGLSEESQRELARVADEDARTHPPRGKHAAAEARRVCGNLPVAGTRFVRRWQGRDYEVVVNLGGYEFEGTRYGSLSAIASKITGTHWNGRVFFGLKNASDKSDKKGKRNRE